MNLINIILEILSFIVILIIIKYLSTKKLWNNDIIFFLICGLILCIANIIFIKHYHDIVLGRVISCFLIINIGLLYHEIRKVGKKIAYLLIPVMGWLIITAGVLFF